MDWADTHVSHTIVATYRFVDKLQPQVPFRYRDTKRVVDYICASFIFAKTKFL